MMRRAVLGLLRRMPAFERHVAPPLYRAREIYGWYYGLHRLRRLSRRPPPAGGWRIVIGAAGAFDRPWVPTEIGYLNVLKAEDWRRWFAPGSLDALLAEHVFEHLTAAEGELAVRHCFAYLRPGGYLRAAVPDGCHPDPAYIEAVKPGGSGPSADDHKVLYTYRTFSELCRQVGFAVELLEYYDEQGLFHQADWDPADGRIRRSRRYARRDRGYLPMSASIILDARKPEQRTAA
jgi:predicted SAM-dependent methyltransferase